MVLLNLVALVAAYMNGHWDAAMHARGEVEQFWYPPQHGIYFALGVVAGVSIAGFVSLLHAPGSLGTKVIGLSASVLVVLSAPPFWSSFGIVPSLMADPWATAWPAAIIAGILGAFPGWWAGTSLRRLRPHAAILPVAIAHVDAA